jgi:uncharacterized repeat protein (TIGR03803 family)
MTNRRGERGQRSAGPSLWNRNWLPRTRRHAAAVALGLAMVVPAGVSNLSAQAPTSKALHQFTGPPDGGVPYAGLVQDSAGNLYGTTYIGGDASCNGGNGCGSVFELGPTGRERVLYSFTVGTDGGYPRAGLVRDSAGNLYGTAPTGGDLSCNPPYGCGAVFKVDATGKETVLYAFTEGADGGTPEGGLIRDAAGNLYGTTTGGGDLSCDPPYGCGTVFKLSPSGAETVLLSFAGYPTDGAGPCAGLLRDAAGNLYGTTQFGGAEDLGTVFKLDVTGKETLLHSFGTGTDGQRPGAGLVRDAAGNLYGTTPIGGSYGLGILFRVDSTGKETVLHNFSGTPDGAYPEASLLIESAGDLYGTTVQGGTYNYGTIYKLDATGKRTVLHSFLGGSDGIYPYAALVRDSAGNLYGTTSYGGVANRGVVFSFRP